MSTHPAWTTLPVTPLPAERAAAPEALDPGTALSLSGGGYRAMLFHVGAAWRLLEAGFLDPGPTARRGSDLGGLARVSSVSGGSITAAVLALRWKEVAPWEHAGAVERFKRLVVAPIRDLAGVTIAGYGPIGAFKVLRSVLLPGSTSEAAAKAYREHLFREATLQDLPDAPRFVLNASNLQSGALWRFEKRHARDWKVGRIDNPRLGLARVVAASAAFPPVLSPATFTFRESDFVPGTGGRPPDDLQRAPFTTRVQLSDGGVYDNLGLETTFKNHRTVFVSDAAAPFEAEERVAVDWARQMVRVVSVIDSQVRALRVRQLIRAYDEKVRHGTYWGIASDIADFPCAGQLPCPHAQTRRLAGIRTDLAKKDPVTQERLINWGYAICDAALRCRVDATLPAPAGFPYPAAGVGE